MGIRYDSYAIKGIDCSVYNGVIDWSKVPGDFSIIRVGYGNTIDSKFVENISNAQKTKLGIGYYWYLDYYNNHIETSSVYNMSDEDWGKKQADNCWNAIKNYKSGIVFLDMESTTGGYAPKIETVFNRAQTIAKSFLERLDSLNKRSNGIYCSLGLLKMFGSWFKTRPLWVAWYPYRTSLVGNMTAVQMSLDQGWSVKPVIWQYASDGIFNDDGIKGGLAFSQMAECDLNGWVGTLAQYESMFGVSTPDDEVIPIPTNTRTIEVKTVIGQYGVTLRKKPEVSILTKIKLLPPGTVLDCLQKVTDSNGNIWQRVGLDQWVAEYNNGIQYLK